MSRHYQIRKLEDIPRFKGDKDEQNRTLKTKMFFLVLNVFKTHDHRRIKFEVTDFTSHPQVFDETCEVRPYDKLVVKTNKILKICLFKDKLNSISQCYEEMHKGCKLNIANELSSRSGASANLDSKLIIMAMNLKWREHGGKLEPFIYDPEIIKWDPTQMEQREQQVVTDLYKNILNHRYFIDHLRKSDVIRLKEIIPSNFLKQFYLDKDNLRKENNSNNAQQPVNTERKRNSKQMEQSTTQNKRPRINNVLATVKV
ncbi:uncharacterized protein KGF55_003893 [Candida pseudojiufengensis]|uniref:uncharacterized protein n=1 Tax=Candida pseudojiufengensis TaxID=497109 RepID=UPI0022240E1A|nr:uncharacterized protein KGF55_003893 [Candida pseudojiufengensis]KAI5961576.1 hypothetical protein KGF55_003893 [Candida pseudojiufengensis]